MGGPFVFFALFISAWLFLNGVAGHPNSLHSLLQGRADSEKPLLRIMPLGASITQGWDIGIAQILQSGYRKPLREELRFRGYAVNMVGSRTQGEFLDNQHEGWPGLEIDQVADKMLPVLTTQKPNLVLILLGSNDCFHGKRDNNMDYVRASKDRMRKMIERIYSKVANTTVILATLPPTREVSDELWIKTANSGYKELAQELAKQGRKIELADMYSTWFLPEDYSDTIHFKPPGYEKMAALFARAFSQIEAKGWLSAPLATGVSDSIGCYPSPSNFHGPVRTQKGSGHDDGDFIYASTFERTKDLEYKQSAPRALLGHFHFANLVTFGNEGQTLDEFVRVLDLEDRAKSNLPFISFHTNKGDANFEPVPVAIDVGQECASQGVRWADVNGDGLDDFICLDKDGVPPVSLNRAGNPPKFEFIGAIRDENTDPFKVRIADVDGDGRADFCRVEINGVYCLRNDGVGDAPTSKYNGDWKDITTSNSDKTLELDPAFDPVGFRLIDINGDGRADWIYMHETTNMDIRINQRGDHSDGTGLKPHWRSFTNQIKDWPNDDKVTRDHVLFGRVFGSGRKDVVRTEQVGDKFDYVFHFYRNTGKGGKEVRGDGMRYCDMYGRGHDDYLWVGADGSIELFELNPDPFSWNPHGKILDTKRDRKFIHVGDWDGDGLCDILAVDRETGNVDMWRNTYKKGDKVPTFEAPVQIVNKTLCPQPIANGNLYDLAVRFADLDGDKRVDYICIDPNGRSSGWLNTPTGLQTMSSTIPKQIKISEGSPRPDIRFADVNGDGRADYLTIDPYTGAVRVWINRGIIPALTSGMSWDAQSSIWMPGKERGANVHFPRLSMSGRADYHVVYPQTGVADTWFNDEGCKGSGAMDDGEVRDPGLPKVPT